ncbi:hypothetical protein Tco_1059541, partial [Tanacetum coccineum]
DPIETKVDDWEFKESGKFCEGVTFAFHKIIKLSKDIGGILIVTRLLEERRNVQKLEETLEMGRLIRSEKERLEVRRIVYEFKKRRMRDVRTKAMLSSDATFSMEMFPFGHSPEGNGDVSSVCF